MVVRFSVQTALLMDLNFAPFVVARCVPAGHRGYGPSGACRLEQLRARGVLQYGAALCVPPAAERLQPTSLHQLCGRIPRLPGLHLHTTREHAGIGFGSHNSITAINTLNHLEEVVLIDFM